MSFRELAAIIRFTLIATASVLLPRIAPSAQGAQANLTPYQPGEWSEKLVVTRTTGTTTNSSSLTTEDTLYVNWAVANIGSGTTSIGFNISLTVDGTVRSTWTSGAVPSNSYVFVTDSVLGSLTAGSHTLMITADSSGVINETNESDNTYTKVISIAPALPSIRVAPETLTFSGSAQNGPHGQNVSPATPNPGTPSVEPAVAAPDDKLVDPLQLAQNFTTGPTALVIVNLTPPGDVLAQTDFRSKKSLRKLQPEIRKLQDELLAGVPGQHIKVRLRFENAAGFSAEVTPEGLQALQRHPLVQSIEPVYVLHAHLAQGIPLIHGLTYRSAYNGAGVAIAICDTGLDYNHPRLGGGGFPNHKVLGGYNFGDNNADPIPNTQAHGTCCAGIAAGSFGTVGDYIGGVAPNAALYALKISSGITGSATSDAMVAAWDWCVTHKDDDPAHPILVISTSFGGGRAFTSCDTDVPSMTTAANNAVAAGITLFASSGNDGYCDSIAWPACISSVMAVGAVYDAAFGDYLPCVDAASCVVKTSTAGCATGWYSDDVTAADKVTSYSNSSALVALVAPANQCSTLDITGADGYSSGDYFTGFGGTSAACPYAAGAAACLQSAALALTGTYLSAAEVRNRLEQTSDSVADSKANLPKQRVNLEQAITTLTDNGQTFRIYNDGPGLLTVSSVTSDTPALWLRFAPPGPFDVPAGGYQQVHVDVDFIQAPIGRTTNQLVLVSNDATKSPYPTGEAIVLQVNTPPIISVVPPQSISAGQATSAIPVGVQDAESPAASLTLSGSSSDQSLVPDSNIVFGGSDSVRTVTVTPVANRSGSCTIFLLVNDGMASTVSQFTLTVNAAVVGRFIFYNQSAFDLNDASANANDDAAIATDKSALLPAGRASFANYTSFTLGINGVMVDIAGLPAGVSASDFTLKVGNDNNPSAWAAAPSPASVTVRSGAGVGGSSRITLVWNSNSIQQQWLQVTVLPTSNTRLAAPDVFYFGNAIAESGNSTTDAQVDGSDKNAARIHRRTFLDPAAIDDPYDYNRDQRVDGSDQNYARINRTTFLNALKLINLTGP